MRDFEYRNFHKRSHKYCRIIWDSRGIWKGYKHKLFGWQEIYQKIYKQNGYCNHWR